MNKKLSVTFQSLYMDGDIEGLLHAALYFDRVNLMDFHFMILLPNLISEIERDEPNRNPFPRTLFSLPPSIQEATKSLQNERIIKIVKSSLFHEESEDSFSNNRKDIFGYLKEGCSDFIKTGLLSKEDADQEVQALKDLAKTLPTYHVPDWLPPIVSFPELYSFMTLVSIIALYEQKCPYVCDSFILNRMISHVFMKGLPDIPTIILEKVNELGFKESFLALEILKTHLPRLAFSHIDDVLEARTKMADELQGFRTEVAALSTEIKSNPFDKDFPREVESIIAGKVNPTINALRRKLETASDKLLIKLAKQLKSPKSYVPLLASTLANVPAVYMIAVSCGLVTAEAALETYFERREAMNSTGLSFLLKVK